MSDNRIELNDTGICTIPDVLLAMERTYAEEELRARAELASDHITQAEYNEFLARRLEAHELVGAYRRAWLEDLRRRARARNRPDPVQALRSLRESYEEDMNLCTDSIPLLLVLTDVIDVLGLDRCEVLGEENAQTIEEWAGLLVEAAIPVQPLIAATV